MSVSKYANECNAWFTPDESERFFVRLDGANGPPDPEHQGDGDIFRSEWDAVSNTWGPPTKRGPAVSTPNGERRPRTAAAGDALCCASGGCICASIRTGGVFGPGDTLFARSCPCIAPDTRQDVPIRSIGDHGSVMFPTGWRRVAPPRVG